MVLMNAIDISWKHMITTKVQDTTLFALAGSKLGTRRDLDKLVQNLNKG